MHHSFATVSTASPKRYMIQLCKHFAHKLPVTQEGDEGSLTFPVGVCRMMASDDRLILRADAEDEASLAQLQEVVARHLLRFAFRETPEIVWQERKKEELLF